MSIADERPRLIEVDYEPLPFVVNPEAALASDTPRVQSQNASNMISDDYPSTYQRGDVEQGSRGPR